jgi:rhamnosyltransferase
LAPQIIDDRSGTRPCAYRYKFFGVRKVFRDLNATEPVQTDNLIASGSLIRTSTLQVLGAMRSDLFVDHVDTEWALRGRSAGYNSYSVPNAVLMHRLGDAVTKVFGKDIHLHTDIRHYYQLRNEVYLAHLKTMGWRWRAYISTRIPYHFVVYSAFSKNRFRASRLLLKAIWDGILGRLGPLSQP